MEHSITLQKEDYPGALLRDDPEAIHNYYKKMINELVIKCEIDKGILNGKITYLEAEIQKLTHNLIDSKSETRMYELKIKDLQKELDAAKTNRPPFQIQAPIQGYPLMPQPQLMQQPQPMQQPQLMPGNYQVPYSTPVVMQPKAAIPAIVKEPPAPAIRNPEDENRLKVELLDFLRQQTRPIPPADGSANPKADFANWCGQVGLTPPMYNAEREGPDHYPTFLVRTVLRGVEIGIGRGMRKTQAEVEAAMATLRNIALWSRCLRMEGDKFHRIGTPINRDILAQPHRVFTLPPEETDINGIASDIIIQANAFVNSNGGFIIIGVNPETKAFNGIPLTKENFNKFADAFTNLTAAWKPRINYQNNFKFRLYPLYTGNQIDYGLMFDKLENFANKKWDSDQQFAFIITVFRGEEKYSIPHDQVIGDIPESLNSKEVMYIHNRGDILLVEYANNHD